MIPMFRGLAGAITLPMVGATSLAVATGALAYAWYQGNSTLSDFNKTLVLSGNQAGLTADRMLVLSRAGQAAGLTFNQTSESLSALVKAGVSGEAQIASISQSVARFSSASGVEVDKVAEAFGKLTTDPTSGLTAMARQFHNVTAEQIAYVAQLQRSGDEAGALQAANEAATKGFDDQTRRLKENMGTLETWADRTARAFKSMWDAVLDIGRPDISGSVNANAGTLNNVTINENCRVLGKLSANQIEGDIVKTVGKAFPRNNSYASGKITVTVYDDQGFDRQIIIPPVVFRGTKHQNFNSPNQQSYWYSTCKLQVLKNGAEIFHEPATDVSRVFSSVIDMPAGRGHVTLTFNVSSTGANNWTPTTYISDLLVVVMKKSTAGISIS
ncbi:TPA: phage tail length tape measure family protein [Escherichia coli]|nr:phage tail length tape measure family protein [Escherichia coli]